MCFTLTNDSSQSSGGEHVIVTFHWYSSSHMARGWILIGLSLNGDETESFCDV